VNGDVDRLEQVLASVGDHLLIEVEVEVEVEGPAGADAERDAGDGRRRLGLVLVAASLVVVATLAVAPARTALASWLRLGSTTVEIDGGLPPPPATAPSIAAGAEPIDRGAAGELLGRDLGPLDRSDLGRVGGFALVPEGGVLVLWPDGTTRWIHRGWPGLEGSLRKLVPDTMALEPVDDLGDEALLVSGEHVLQTPYRSAAATTAVLWVEVGWVHRLESDRPADELVAIARQLAADTGG
jgi:hypothetical protein